MVPLSMWRFSRGVWRQSPIFFAIDSFQQYVDRQVASKDANRPDHRERHIRLLKRSICKAQLG